MGEGIRTSGVAREELFVSTKLAAEIKDYDGAVAAIDGSLEKLGLEYIDLMLIHSPQPWDDFRGGDYADGNRQAWRALEDAYKDGKIRAIGVSNFQQQDLENILSGATVVPQVNQLLVHVGNTPTDLLTYCMSKYILVEAYSPIAHGEILKNAEVPSSDLGYHTRLDELDDDPAVFHRMTYLGASRWKYESVVPPRGPPPNHRSPNWPYLPFH